MKLNKVCKSDYHQLYQMMITQNFPSTPQSLEQAAIFFDKATILGVYNASTLVAAVLLFPTDNKCYCVDGVCLPEYEGKWATKGIVKAILSYVFGVLGCTVLWTESERFKAKKFTKALGFKKVCQTKHGELSVLTPLTTKFYSYSKEHKLRLNNESS